MEIGVRNGQRKVKTDVSWMRNWTERILFTLGLPEAELSILLVSDRRMKELNWEYRGIPRSTDVLSFSMREGELGALHPYLLGDVVISLETASKQALEKGHSLDREIRHLLIHGILHLLGYDHEGSPEKRREMEALEMELLVRK